MKNINLSYWHKTSEKLNFLKLDKDIKVDTLIIGAGITGITSAYSLTKKGIDVVVIEAGNLANGTTGNTTGKLTIQHDLIYSKIIDNYGIEYAVDYANSQKDALSFIEDVVKKENIDCQLIKNDSHIYAVTDDDLNKLKKEFEVNEKLGADIEFIEDFNFPSGNRAMVKFKDQAVIHATRYINGLAKAAVENGAKIYCSTKAIKVEDGDIITVHCENNIIIKAKHLIMATQYPIYDGPNMFYTRLFPNRVYGVAVEPINDWPDGSYINIGDPSRSLRTHIEDGKKVLIVVGDDHFPGQGEEEKDKHFDNLIKFANEVAGVKNVLARWSAQDYYTPDEIPYICRLSKNSNIFVATGFHEWGLTNGTLAGMMFTDFITGTSNKYEYLYSKTRADYLSGLGKVTLSGLNYMYQFTKSKIEATEDVDNIKQGDGAVVKYNGKRAGIYRDYDDRVIILNIACTHLGTGLNFNPLEKTWDCPSHGGRYNVYGKLLEGPPKDNLKIIYYGYYNNFINE